MPKQKYLILSFILIDCRSFFHFDSKTLGLIPDSDFGFADLGFQIFRKTP